MLSTGLLLAASMVGGQADKPVATAEDYSEFMEYYAGEWKTTWTEDGEVTHGSTIIQWSPGKRAQTVRLIRGDQIVRQSLWGFDASRKRWCGLAFNFDGSSDFGIHGPEVLKAKYGKPFKTKSKVAEADGTTVDTVWKTTLIDENTYEVELHSVVNGEQKLVLKVRQERKVD